MSYRKKFLTELREEFQFACGYCHTREGEFGGVKNFEIDHYTPVSVAANLTNEYSNLIYSCRTCNRAKSDFWPNSSQQKRGELIFNPRPLGNINNHILIDNPEWKFTSKCGQFSIERLDLNSIAIVERRTYRDKSIKALTELEEKAKKLEELHEEMVSLDINPENIFEIKEDIQRTKMQIDIFKYQLKNPKD
ncbi:HNH endonuclease [Legionella sainthelensi]|uniref:HNH endonuclease n=1 Tax=Legionella sainthelensi TaxID=28087 RepID=UPI000E205FAE|nr:HNH endonuclease signature motif containing protein [Legionella sainthelensi]